MMTQATKLVMANHIIVGNHLLCTKLGRATIIFFPHILEEGHGLLMFCRAENAIKILVFLSDN